MSGLSKRFTALYLAWVLGFLLYDVVGIFTDGSAVYWACAAVQLAFTPLALAWFREAWGRA